MPSAISPTPTASRFIAPQGVSTEAEPSARDIARIITQIRRLKIPAVFLENVSDPRLMQRIAQETGARVGGKLYSDALTDANGEAPDYIALMRHNTCSSRRRWPIELAGSGRQAAALSVKIRPMSTHSHDDHDDHGSELSEMQLRVRALETILTEKGYVDPKALDLIVEAYETKIGPHNGARVVAKAWADPDFKRRLLEDATAAVSALGHVSRVGDHLVAVENTPQAPQHGRVHAVLLLSVGGARPAAGLVQVRALSLARRQGPARRARRFRRRALPKETEIRVWDLDRRDALPRAADAPGRHRRLERGAARRRSSPATP